MKENLTGGERILLGFQHLFAMFGATVLVPALTGLNPSIALICAGLGTLMFHFFTEHKVPVFLGSSFAYIAAISAVVNEKGVPYAQGGIIVAGLVYLLMALVVFLAGAQNVRKIFPPVVTGPVIVVIGINLAPVGVSMASQNWWIALIVLATVIGVSAFCKNFFKLVPILIGLVAGYIAALIFDVAGLTAEPLVNLQLIRDASWLISPKEFTLPVFDMHSILMIAPVAFVTFMEHIGDITTNGSVVGKDFFEDPGLHKTLIGDGLATSLAGFLGGPANTTYSENTGVLAVTKVYDTGVIKIAAGFAIFMGIMGKMSAILLGIPDAVKGGMSIMLFGMIAAVGMRTLVEAQLDFSHSRNLIVVALILVFGLGLTGGVTIGGFTFSGLFVSVVVGVAANKILPQNV